MQRAAVILLLLALLVVPLMGVATTASRTYGAEAPGSSPDSAIELTGPLSYTIIPNGYAWFRFWLPGHLLEHGVVMFHNQATPSISWRVGFNVWVYQNQVTGVPQLIRLGDSTPLQESLLDTQYWRGYAPVDQNYYVRVFNNATVPIDYVLATTAQAYPPPGIPIAVDRTQPQPGVTAVPSPWAYPTDTPTPTVVPIGGGRSADDAPYLGDDKPVTGVLGGGDRSWLRFNTFGGGRTTGVNMTFTPVTEENRDIVFFKIWVPKGGPSGLGLVEIGRGTMSGNPFGPKFWRGGADVKGATYIQIINDGDVPVEWTVSLDNRQPPAVR
jgi:hypothetical protein